MAEATDDSMLPIAQIGNEMAFDGEELVYILTLYLADRCDGAHTPDGQGFNKLHTAFGKSLAEIPYEHWSDRQLYAARRMLQTYKNTQLAQWWHLVPELKAPIRQTDREAQYTAWKQRQDPTWQPEEAYRRLVLLEHDGHAVIGLEQNYDARLIERIKLLPQRHYDPASQTWIVPIHIDSLEAIAQFACEFDYEIAPEVEAKLNAAIASYELRVELSHAKDGDYTIALPDGLELYPFQRIGVQYAEHVGNVLIADQMGLGKTVQALLTLEVTKAFPAVVVCPASIKGHWAREAQKWLPGIELATLSGREGVALTDANGEARYDMVIVNYDILDGWKDAIIEMQPQALVADECHKVKNQQAARSKAMLHIIQTVPEMRRIFLSGTPVVNRPMEFWTLIRMLGYSDAFGGIGEYQRRYDEYATKSRLEELNTRARSYFMIRRLKADVLPELPDKQRINVPIEIDNRRDYEEAELDIAGYFATKASDAANDTELQLSFMQEAIDSGMDRAAMKAHIRAQMERTKGAAYMQAYAIASRNEELLRWEALKQLAVKGKMKAVEAWIDEFLESDEKLVIFATHTAITERLARRYNAVLIRGGVKAEDRTRIEERFQSDPSCRVLVGNMQAAGEGLNLQTSCSNVCFVEYGWNPKDHDQAEDRLHRIGQKDNVTVWNLMAEGTIDEEICALIESKRIVTNAIQDGGGKDMQREFMDALRSSLQQRIKR